MQHTRHFLWAVRRDWEADRLDGAGMFARQAREPKNDSNEFFVQLGRIARVPPNRIERFRAWISSEFDREWYWYRHAQNEEPPPEFSVKQLTVLKKQCSELHAVLKKLDEPTLEHLMIAATYGTVEHDDDYPPAPPDPKWIQTVFPNYVRAVAELAKYSENALKSRKLGRRRGRGRPARRGFLGPYAPGSFNFFVLRLLWDVQESGGKLSLDKNVGKGGLVDALELLRPHFPPKLIPKALPLSTLAKIKALDKKIGFEPKF
jgi:hypothetical protein